MCFFILVLQNAHHYAVAVFVVIVVLVSQIRAPVLISCGRNDSLCPIQPVEKFVRKLQELNRPHEFRVQEKEGHGFARVDALIQEVRTAIEYLEKTLKLA
jgi:dipeptidyl aminopeptidase/acylaminoacyl peptidase